MSKTRLSWIEPRSFCAESAGRKRASRRWWHGPLAMLGIFVFSVASWKIAHLNPKNHPPPLTVAIPVMLALVAFVVYVFPWIIAKLPSRIVVTDKCLVRIQGHSHHVLLTAVRSFDWQEGPDHHTLILVMNRGRELRFGVPREMVREVTALLATTPAAGASASTGYE